MFKDRESAARLLAQRLERYRAERPLVLGVPRGGVPMGAVLADALHGDLDVVLVHKLGAPGQPELAIGAVDETGHVTLDPGAMASGLDEAYVEEERQGQWQTLLLRRERYTPARQPVDPSARTVIVVDDGVATGATLAAALRLLRERGPKRLIAATAVAPPEAVRRLRREADDVVVLATPEHFVAVGAFFVDFRQVTDEEVVALLERRRSGAVCESPATGRGAGVARWEHFEHDADVGVRGYGAAPADAFEQAALALTGVVVDPSSVAPAQRVPIRCEAPDLEVLLVDWLNALIYEMATRRMLFGRFDVHIDTARLTADAWGEPVRVQEHQPAVEVKGASFTAVRVARQPDGVWVAQCVVDV